MCYVTATTGKQNKKTLRDEWTTYYKSGGHSVKLKKDISSIKNLTYDFPNYVDEMFDFRLGP